MAEEGMSPPISASHDAERPPSTSTSIAVGPRIGSEAFIQQAMQLSVASISLLGVGCAAGFYLAPAGYFEHNFKDTRFFLWMIMALFLPYPIMLFLQEKLDEYFDAKFGPRSTYFFRVIAVQMVSVVLFGCYSLSKSPIGVLLCGVLIGACTAASLASTMQLMAAWDPHLTAWASLGKDFAQAFPVVTYLMLGFSASTATPWDFQVMQVFPMSVICLCTLTLSYLHAAGAWDKAYQRLGFDLFDADEQHSVRQVSCETAPLLPEDEVDSSGAPLWIPKWQCTQGLNTLFSFMLLPLVTSMRNPDLTQKLTLFKLAMDFFSRVASAAVSKTDFFGAKRPSHYFVLAQLVLRTILFAAMMAHLLHLVILPVKVFTFLWLPFYFVGNFAASQIDVTIARFAPVPLRKAATRRTTLANFSGLALGLAVDVILVFTAFQ